MGAAPPRYDPEWSAPDAQGLVSAWLGDPHKSSLRGRRLRQAAQGTALEIDAWPASWRALLKGLVRRASPDKRIRFESLLAAGGEQHATAAMQVFQTLLRAGALRVEEQRDPRRGWTPKWLWFLAPAQLRAALGLPEPDAAQREWIAARGRALPDEDLDRARAALDALPPPQALARLELLHALQRWREEKRHRGFATQRDFAWFARGSTKSISDAEWRWLADCVELASDGIAAHAPLLLIAGRLVLHGAGGVLDCAALGGFIGLPARGIADIKAIANPPTRWLLVENRSAFEHQARRLRDDEALLWVPGYPPRWWHEAVEHLLALAPAPALIACDPDPDGVRIALIAGAAWAARRLEWKPWCMSAGELAGLTQHRSLTERDRELISTLMQQPLAPGLAELLTWMRDNDRKGEQEPLFSKQDIAMLKDRT